LATCMPKQTGIVVTCDPGMKKCEVLHFGGVQRHTCRAISASAELLVKIRLFDVFRFEGLFQRYYACVSKNAL